MPGSTDVLAVETVEPVSVTRIAPRRDLYIDRLRSVMTAFVIFHHTAITYGAVGGWFYKELHPSDSVSSLLLTLFCATQQAYFMGFFFYLLGTSLRPRSNARATLASFLTASFALACLCLCSGSFWDR